MVSTAIMDMLATTTPPRPQTRLEQFPAPQDTATPAPSANCSTTYYESDYPLVSHLSHLLNAAVSCLNVYLSFEPPAHKVNAGNLHVRPRTDLIDIYRSGMYAQASILRDLAANIKTVLNKPLQTSLH